MAEEIKQANLSDMVFGDEFNVPDVAQADPEQPAEKKGRTYTKEIDLGDGSGKQVFTGDSPTELSDKLAEAQVNASREIRKLQRQLKMKSMVPAIPERGQKPRTFTPQPLSQEEAFLLVQNHPEKIGEVLFQRELGMSPADFRAELNELRAVAQNSREERAGTEFLVAHQEDYLPNQENANAIEEFLTQYELPRTRQNLEFAFTQLSSMDLLEVPKAQADEDDKDSGKTRIEPPKKKKTMSGLSSTMSQQPDDTQEDTIASEAEKIRNLNIPLDQKRERIAALMIKARQAQSAR